MKKYEKSLDLFLWDADRYYCTSKCRLSLSLISLTTIKLDDFQLFTRLANLNFEEYNGKVFQKKKNNNKINFLYYLSFSYMAVVEKSFLYRSRYGAVLMDLVFKKKLEAHIKLKKYVFLWLFA